MTGLDRLNSLPEDDAVAALRRCCGSSVWAARVAARRPFASAAVLLETADEIWSECTRDDLLEAFASHPRIGATANASSWSRGEQAAAAGAGERVRTRLVAGNDAYYERFGYIFLICAEGRSAGEILEQLEARLEHDPETEMATAAEEQRQITGLRLTKLLAELAERE